MKKTLKPTNRRKFLGTIGGVSAAAVVTNAIGLPAIAGLTATTAEAAVADYNALDRATASGRFPDVAW